jgi:hypothetical protein
LMSALIAEWQQLDADVNAESWCGERPAQPACQP